jgi:ubiquinone biosynthesis protein
MRLLAVAATVVLVVASALGMIIAFAMVARRLLGLRFGVVRLLLAGVLAVAVMGPISRPILAPATTGQITPALWFFILALAGALLVAMAFLVVAEALVPSGSLPGPLGWRRQLRGRIARTRRYFEISRIAMRHGLLSYLRGRRRARLDNADTRAEVARAVRRALDEGGVTFVKLGQVLSTRRDLLPVEFIDELSKLQDRAAPAAWGQVQHVLTAELDRPVDEVFPEIDPHPLAAASIAQVHSARLPSGAEVVVKVQRPGIRQTVDRDLEIVARLARTLERATRWGRSIGVRDLAGGFAAALREELDFRIEADNMAGVAAASAGRDADDAVLIPTPHQSLCTKRVLVMQRLEGTPLGAAGPVIAEPGLDRHELARALLASMLRQILVDGVFHADPHPGNVLVLTDGRLGLLDFGLVGRLDASVRGALQRLLLAMDRGDPLAASDALLEVVSRPEEIDQQHLERALGRFMARHLARGMTVRVQMFTDLFGIVSEHGLSIPPELAAVFRALATLEGTLDQLAPELNLVDQTRSIAGRYLAGQFGPAAARQAIIDDFTTLLPMLRRLPRRVERIASAAEHGRLSVQVRLFADERDRRTITVLLQQVLLTILAATAGVMGVLLLGTGGGPRVTTTVGLYQLFGYNLLVVCVVLALRVLVLIFRPDR